MKYILVVLCSITLLISANSVEYKFEGMAKYRNVLSHPGQHRTSNPEMFSFVDKFLPKNPMIFEAGGNDGTDSVTMAQHWKGGKIVTFEPLPSQFAKYQEKAIDYSNMEGYNLAVNTYNGKTKFYVCWGTGGTDPEFEGASSLLEASESMKQHYMGPEIEVDCVVLDDWCQENGIEYFDFLWLDLEGFELQLLESSPNVVKNAKAIYLETNLYPFRKNAARYSQIKKFMKKNGFKLAFHWYIPGLQGNALFIRRELLR